MSQQDIQVKTGRLTDMLGQLEDKQQQLEQLVEHIPLSIAMFNTNMEYLVANRMWIDGYGLGDQDIIGKSHYEIFPEIGDDWKAIHKRCLAGDIDRNDRAPFPRADGKMDYIRWEVRPWFRKDGGTGGLVMYTEVITQRVELELEREDLLKREREAREKAEEATRLKDLFLATMSHELRTPLNAMMGYLQLSLFSGQLSEDNQYMIERSLGNSKRLLTLINDILDLSRINAGTLKIVPADVSIKTITDTIYRDISLQVGDKPIEFMMVVEESIPETITHDSDRITQIIINLLTNAIKFTEDGHIKAVVNCKDDTLILQVEDTGKGIPPSKLESIFDDFVQMDNSMKRQHRGVGLDLAIVKRLVMMMDGTINVESEVNVGSTFTVTLPLNLPIHDTTTESE